MISGSIFANLIAGFIIVTAAAVFVHGHRIVNNAAGAAKALAPFACRYAGVLLAVGLFAVGLFAAVIVPMTVAYVIGEWGSRKASRTELAGRRSSSASSH